MRLIILSPVIVGLLLVSCQMSDTTPDGPIATASHASNRVKASNYAISTNASLEGIVTQALAHHPSLVAAQYKITRLQAKVPQEQALPDPKARISAGNLAETAAGKTSAMVGLEQQIPFSGKRKAKARAAQKEVDAARAEHNNLKLIIAERVRTAYWNYYLAYQNQRISR